MKIIIRHILIFLITTCSLVSKAQQDPIFTQYMFNIQSVNPAYAGMWEKVGFIAMVRKQWAGIDRSPLTEVISFHTPLQNEYVGLGFNVINDAIGREKRLSIFGDYSYKVLLSSDISLRLGLKFGFLNYKNPLSEYRLYPDGEYDPAFQGDIDLKFMPNFGVGGFMYSDYFYVSLSIPKLIKNDFRANYNNYSSVSEARYLYLSAGIIYYLPHNIKFKPSGMLRATWGAPIQLDIGANLHFFDRFEIGLMYRTGDALCALGQFKISPNLTIGYATDFTLSEIREHQNGTHEIYLSFDVDYYGRTYIKNRYF